MGTHRTLPIGERALAAYRSSTTLWALVGLGALLRLVQYLANRSLWFDEARLALNILERSFFELTQPLSYYQGAPILFLWAEKAVVTLAGESEAALRLVPLASGLAALIVMRYLAPAFLDRDSAPLALLLFATSGPLIYYSSEVKQYSSDVFVAATLLGLALWHLADRSRPGRLLALGAAGIVAIWLSHPAVFVLAGFGTVWFFDALRRGDRRTAAGLAVFGSAVASSFVAFYVVSLHELQRESIFNWREVYPQLPASPRALRWYLNILTTALKRAAGLGFVGLAAFLLLTGSLALGRRSRARLALLLSPLPFLLLAAVMQRYPLVLARFLLFLVPMLLVLIAAGIGDLGRRSRALGVGALVLVMVHPIADSVRALRRAEFHEEVRDVLERVELRRLPDERIYVHYSAIPQFRYYAVRMGLVPASYRLGVQPPADWDRVSGDLDAAFGEDCRWLLFAGIGPKSPRMLDRIVTHLERHGRVTQSLRGPGAAAYRFDVPPQPADP